MIKSSAITDKGLLLYETLFHVANAYLRVRGNVEEGQPVIITVDDENFKFGNKMAFRIAERHFSAKM